MTDHPMTGAQFRRWAGIDPARWAEGCQRAHAEDDLDELTVWFRDAMQAAAATAEGAWMEVAKRRDQDEAEREA